MLKHLWCRLAHRFNHVYLGRVWEGRLLFSEFRCLKCGCVKRRRIV